MSIDIAELRRLAKAATPGPYAVSEIGAGFEVAAGGEIFAQAQQVAGDVRSARRKANAAYIAAACTAIPSLLDELEGLRTENEAVRLANIDGKMWVDSTRDEMEKLRKDAERYRWLKAWQKTDGFDDTAIDREIAIDAAIRAEGKGDE